jgi:hypothetical protein
MFLVPFSAKISSVRSTNFYAGTRFPTIHCCRAWLSLQRRHVAIVRFCLGLTQKISLTFLACLGNAVQTGRRGSWSRF